MANQVEQQMMFCPQDQKTTLFYRNVKGRNWALHILLILVTGGLWLLAMIFMKSGGSGLWTCSQCGTTQK